ncbi:hypothetical protein EDB80DRAFT_591908, partial [Ilyonectria destructans]
IAVILYGSLRSTCTQRVTLVLAELGVKYKFTHIKLQEGEHKAYYVNSYHPFGRIPVLGDDGLRIFESREPFVGLLSRNTYLEKHQSPEDVARYELASSVEYLIREEPVLGLVLKTGIICNITFMGFGDPNPVEVSKLTDLLLHTTLEYHEQITSKSNFLAQDKFSLIDLHHMPWIHFLSKLGLQEEISARPSLKVW